jgi:hypothetical protein
MANDRRIITGTHVVISEGNIMEDTTVHKYIIDSTIGKTLGGKSIVTDVADTQDFAGGNSWYRGDNKASALVVSGDKNCTFPTGVTTDSEDVQFLYVRNLDTTLDCYISLTTVTTWDGTWAALTAGNWQTSQDNTKKSPSYDGRWDEGMYIIVPPGGSVQLRGDSTNHLEMNHVRFRSADPLTAINIEYVLAE